MIIQESPALHDVFLKLLVEKYKINQVRPGNHLSSLTRCLTIRYWDEHDPIPPDEETALTYAVGWLLEDFSIDNIHIPQFEVDGILMTVDFALGIPADLKSTRMAVETSAGCGICGEPFKGHSKRQMGHAYEKAPPLPFQLPHEWQKRFMGYRYGLNRLHPESPSTRFGVVIFHIIQPALKAYEARFSQQELTANWAWVLSRKAAYEAMEATSDPQPFQHNDGESSSSWECMNCRYHLTCSLYASLHPKETALGQA